LVALRVRRALKAEKLPLQALLGYSMPFLTAYQAPAHENCIALQVRHLVQRTCNEPAMNVQRTCNERATQHTTNYAMAEHRPPLTTHHSLTTHHPPALPLPLPLPTPRPREVPINAPRCHPTLPLPVGSWQSRLDAPRM
jgi:hypothetical protein